MSILNTSLSPEKRRLVRTITNSLLRLQHEADEQRLIEIVTSTLLRLQREEGVVLTPAVIEAATAAAVDKADHVAA